MVGTRGPRGDSSLGKEVDSGTGLRGQTSAFSKSNHCLSGQAGLLGVIGQGGPLVSPVLARSAQRRAVVGSDRV